LNNAAQRMGTAADRHQSGGNSTKAADLRGAAGRLQGAAAANTTRAAPGNKK
jgi:hypothetical protein